jgi:hypothetical protein
MKKNTEVLVPARREIVADLNPESHVSRAACRTKSQHKDRQ